METKNLNELNLDEEINDLFLKIYNCLIAKNNFDISKEQKDEILIEELTNYLIESLNKKGYNYIFIYDIETKYLAELVNLYFKKADVDKEELNKLIENIHSFAEKLDNYLYDFELKTICDIMRNLAENIIKMI